MSWWKCHLAIHSNLHNSLENCPNVIAESSFWLIFVTRVGRNSSVALLTFCTPVFSQEVCNYWHQWQPDGQFILTLCLVIYLGPSWVLLFGNFQIDQPLVILCLSVGTAYGGRQTQNLPCPFPSQSSSLFLTLYVKWKQDFVRFNEWVKRNVMRGRV